MTLYYSLRPYFIFRESEIAGYLQRTLGNIDSLIDLLATLEKSLDRAIFLYNFMREVRLSGVRASIATVYSRKFY